MKKMLAAASLIAFSPIALADDDLIYLYDPEPGAIYITAGGGVAGILNEDWQLHTTDPTAAKLKQPESKNNTVGVVSAALGYEFDPLPVRVEFAYRWYGTSEYHWDHLYETTNPATDSETAKGSIDSQAVLFNLYWDWRNSTGFTPYIGGGIGAYFNRTQFERTNEEDPANSTVESASHENNGLAWAAMLGFKYNIGPNWFLDVRAEYVDLGHADFYEKNADGEFELMNTDTLSAISGLVNLTYEFSLDQW